jgi:hypothetical protein
MNKINIKTLQSMQQHPRRAPTHADIGLLTEAV